MYLLSDISNTDTLTLNGAWVHSGYCDIVYFDINGSFTAKKLATVANGTLSFTETYSAHKFAIVFSIGYQYSNGYKPYNQIPFTTVESSIVLYENEIPASGYMSGITVLHNIKDGDVISKTVWHHMGHYAVVYVD